MSVCMYVYLNRERGREREIQMDSRIFARVPARCGVFCVLFDDDIFSHKLSKTRTHTSGWNEMVCKDGAGH